MQQNPRSPRGIVPTDVERSFDVDEFIVSKTDTRGVITYANDVFLRVARYREDELIGKPHNVIRHPDMPRCVFRYVWDRLQAGEEVFGYVKNLASDGAFYWVFAHLTPSYDRAGRLVGYHSNRRVPERSAVDAIAPLYRELLEIETRTPGSTKARIDASLTELVRRLQQIGMDYDAFVFSFVPDLRELASHG